MALDETRRGERVLARILRFRVRGPVPRRSHRTGWTRRSLCEPVARSERVRDVAGSDETSRACTASGDGCALRADDALGSGPWLPVVQPRDGAAGRIAGRAARQPPGDSLPIRLPARRGLL